MLRYLKYNYFLAGSLSPLRFLLFLGGLLTITHSLQAQEYLWPTNASRCLTSSFGEVRSDHLHSGIDIKTWGREGYKVFATRDGYIWRLRVSPFGYGKVIYQILDTGETVVYAHLQKFAPSIESYVKRLQRRQGRYSLDHYLSAHKFPVQKGDLIGYTGSTGAGAPHLHFEIRDRNNSPFNALRLGSPVQDDLAPIATRLSLSPRNLGSQVNGWFSPQIFDLQQETATSFFYPTPIQIWGEIGISISAYDLANEVKNWLSVYRIQLLIDGQLLFESRYDSYSFEQTRQVFLDRDYRLLQWGEGRFYRLCLEEGNHLPFYNSPQAGTGVLITAGYPRWMAQNENFYQLFSSIPRLQLHSYCASDREILQILNLPYTYLEQGSHSLTILLQDFYGNTSTVNAQLQIYRKIVPQIECHITEDVLAIVSPDSTPECLRVSYVSEKSDHWRMLLPVSGESRSDILISTLDTLSLLMPQTQPAAIKFEYLDSRDNCSYPFFVFSDDSNYGFLTQQPEVQLQKQFLDNYVVFQITTATPLFSQVQLELENPVWGVRELPLVQPNLTMRMAAFPLSDLSLDTTFLRVYVVEEAERILCLAETLAVTRIDCGSSKQVVSADGNFVIKFTPKSHLQPLYVRTETKKDAFLQKEYPLPVVPIYHVEPMDIPLWRRIEVQLCYPETIPNPDKLGIYSPSEKKDWNFIDNRIDFERRIVGARVKNLGEFTLLQDLQPPEILRTSPRPGSYLRSRFPLIQVFFRDQLSGIGSEENIVLKLDGDKLISEYDPEKECASYQVESPLFVGKHSLYISLKDNSGNVCEKTVSFYIRN